MNISKKIFSLVKNNYQFIACFILLVFIFIITINPSPYIFASLNGFLIWGKIVLPSLFCFFILTKLLMQFDSTLKIFNFLNKPFEKLYNTPKVGGYIFAMSAISGYPIGAKLISEFYENNVITKEEAFRLATYCSTSGPMFIIGSIASSLFFNIKLGIVIIISHLLGALINGLIFRKFNLNHITINKKNAFTKVSYNIITKDASNLNSVNFEKKNDILTKKFDLNEIMLNTITSVLMVGGYIALCFTLLEIAVNIGILTPIVKIIDLILPRNLAISEGLVKGIVELTNGCVYFANKNIPIRILAVALTGLVSFGGFSIHLQSQMFLSKCKIKYKNFLLSKILHSIISVVLSLIFSIIIL